MSEFAINTETNRLIKKSTAKYKRLFKLGKTKEIPVADEPKPKSKPESESESESEFNERDLQHKMAEMTTDMVASNMKQIIKSQKLSDAEYDTLLKKMLFKKLCQPTKPAKKKPKKKAKKRFKVVSSESESESSD
jgi:hypothetical protein